MTAVLDALAEAARAFDDPAAPAGRPAADPAPAA
jgi:hypothetical protein